VTSLVQAPGTPAVTESFTVNIDCDQKMNNPDKGSDPWDKCMCQQLCAKVKKMDSARKQGKMNPVPGARTLPAYKSGKKAYIDSFMKKVAEKRGVRSMFIHKCAADKYMNSVHPGNPTTGGTSAPFNADHMHEAALGGSLTKMSNFKMLDRRVNQSISFQKYEPDGKHAGKPIKAHPSCNCPNGPE